ncbi:MAG: hypothetical protein QME52_08950 [Bacteroidota bacterium]|nr:hypothetical protein [Bacteroidota bacterium]
MNVFKKLIGKKPDPLTNRANNLVSVSHIGAIEMYIPLLDRFPFLRKVDVKQWDFIVTVAGVFIASTRLNNLNLDLKRENVIMDIVSAKLQEWDRDAVGAFEDCKVLFEREFDRLTTAGHESRFIASDALGVWVVWNVLGRQPQSQEEIKLVRVVGGMTTHNLFDWWTSN